MQTEIEAKWLNIDKAALRKALLGVGAELVSPERLMIRRAYDFPDERLESVKGWVRVRNEDNKITLSYKQLDDRTIHGTKEVTVVVNDFDSTCSFLESIGLMQKSVQETKRESWKLGNSEIELDTWPWIPSFVEIESTSEAELKTAAELLGLDYSKALHGSVETAYKAVYDVTEEEVNGWKEIRFVAVPTWLSSKKIN
ncbi:adenylyl cyclase [Candidatus Saccharibacteria bacterium HGW-Saccharibacteria-1]|jgi:adenylate cyclase class 2|nr:MAG: adenylyl cyclase [Candidatus Saccharibacteria bacterium HGW-Saccharibacteria-1]